MNSSRTIKTYHSAIIKVASAKLGRKLTDRERQFITSRQGFLALKAISDTVNYEPKEYVEQYLNSE